MAEIDPPGFSEASQPFGGPVRLKVGPDGRILIPADMRRAAGLEPGATVLADLRDGEIRLATSATRLRRLQAIVRRHDRGSGSVVDEFIADKRAEAARE